MSSRSDSTVFGADPFEHDDAAYLLGALSPAARDAFEQHLAGCPACTARVSELRGTTGLLAAVGEADLAGMSVTRTEEPPDDLLPALVGRVEAARRRRHWVIGALGGLAAAALVVLGVALGTSGSGGNSPTAATRPMTELVSVPLQAKAGVTAEPWGTQISLQCSYLAEPGYAGTGGQPAVYALRVTDRDGTIHQLGSWTVRAGTDTRFTSGTAIATAQISAVQITLPDGTPVLQLSL